MNFLRIAAAAGVLAALISPAGAAGLPDWAEVDGANGVMKIGGFGIFEVTHFGPNWQGFSQRGAKALPEYPKTEKDGALIYRGVMPSGGAKVPMQIEVAVTPKTGGGLLWKGRVTPETPVDSETMALQGGVDFSTDSPPVIAINGVVLNIPEEASRAVIYDAPARQLDLISARATLRITGKFTLFVQDARHAGRISLRLIPLNLPREIAKWRLSLDFALIPSTEFNSELQLKGAAQRNARRKIAGCDLTPTLGKMVTIDGISTKTPENADGRTLIAVDCDGGTPIPETAVLRPSGAGTPCRYLYLLHTAPKVPGVKKAAGVLTLSFKSGENREFAVTSGVDIGGFMQPRDIPNGRAVAVSATADGKSAGWYLSRFTIDEVPEKIEFTAAPDAVWCIAGGCFDSRFVKLYTPSSYVDKAGDKWFEVGFDGEVQTGSPLDFSRFVEAPVGKYGRVTIDRAGHFVFENAPEKRIRFSGVNLCGYSCFMPREKAEALAVQFRKLGYNSVRLHHFDNPLIDPAGADSTVLSGEEFDKLCYLVAQFKKNGIYVTIDLYCSRRCFKPGELPSGLAGRDFRGAINIEKAVLDNFKGYARNLLTRVNPYTGLAFGEDPVLFAVNLVNENDLIQRFNSSPELEKRYREAFKTYLEAEKLIPLPEGTSEDGLFIDFLNLTQRRTIAEQMRFLREELGMKFLITDLNYPGHATQAGNRRMLDLVDSHEYWDHPQFGGAASWTPPIRYNNHSALREKARYMRWIMPRRIFGKPHIVTEYNYCQPNPYRVELPGLLGGYAGLQDWDGLWRFCWVESYQKLFHPVAPWGFEAAYDPLAQYSDRVTAMLFARGDVAAAKPKFAFRFSDAWVRSLSGAPTRTGYYPEKFAELGLYGQIGTSFADDPASKDIPAVDVSDKNWQERLPDTVQRLFTSRTLVSATGEMELVPDAGTLKVITPRSEVLTGESAVSGKMLAFHGANGLQTAALLALDGEILSDSRDLLLFHLVDVSATGRKYGDPEHQELISYGGLPLLIRRASAEMTVAVSENFKVTRLRLDGSDAGEVPAQYENGVLKFKVATDSVPGGVMAYHLTPRQK